MGKPSKGTPADKRLKANGGGKARGGGSARASGSGSSASKAAPFGGRRAAPFAKGGGRKK
jgi:hypothetical protein